VLTRLKFNIYNVKNIHFIKRKDIVVNLKKSIFKRLLFATLFLLSLHFVCISFTGLQSAVYAETPVSQETVDFMTKTSRSMAEVVESVRHSIVNIATERSEKFADIPFNPFYDDPLFRRFFGDRFRQPDQPRERKTASLASGVIVSPDGYILTNNHVISNADEIKVILTDKREFTGKIIGTDPKTDLAVIQIEAQNLSSITWGDSDELSVGELVLAIGNPYGLNQTVTMGIVSAVGRANVGIADYEDFIQTDAAINPGNSGGALVNAKAELVGINTAIFSRTGGYQGIGFAIPSNMAKIVIDSLIAKGKVIRGWLGVSVQSITPELAKQFNLEEDSGALVAEVVEDSPAEEAGILRGDVIIGFNNKEVDEPYILRNTVAGTPPGEVVELEVIRDSKVKELMVKIGELPSKEQKTVTKAYKNAMRGIAVEDLTPEIQRELNLPENMRGVVISNIERGVPAEEKLFPGDVILEINKKAVTDTEDYEKKVSKIDAKQVVLLLIYRKGSPLFITIAP
jgi:serine protease Do